MVRFSDMLGGSGEPEDAAAVESPYAALASEEAPDSDDDAELEADAEDAAEAVREPVPMSTFESPEAVLDRLTQFAALARAAEPVAPEPVGPEAPVVEPAVAAEPQPEPEVEPDPLLPVGDDFLPNERGPVRRRRGRKRHP